MNLFQKQHLCYSPHTSLPQQNQEQIRAEKNRRQHFLSTAIVCKSFRRTEIFMLSEIKLIFKLLGYVFFQGIFWKYIIQHILPYKLSRYRNTTNPILLLQSTLSPTTNSSPNQSLLLKIHLVMLSPYQTTHCDLTQMKYFLLLLSLHICI